MRGVISILNIEGNPQNLRYKKRFCGFPKTCGGSPAGTDCFFLILALRCADSSALGCDPPCLYNGSKEGGIYKENKVTEM